MTNLIKPRPSLPWRGKDGIYKLYKGTPRMKAFEKYFVYTRHYKLHQCGVFTWDLSWYNIKDLWGYLIGFANTIGLRISWHGSNISWTAQMLDIEPETLKVVYQKCFNHTDDREAMLRLALEFFRYKGGNTE